VNNTGGTQVKKLFYMLLIFSISLFASEPSILKIEDRVTNELVERSEKYFKEYKEWQIKEHNKWLKEEIEWKKLGNQDYSRIRPKLNPDITYEEYREKGYLGNWLVFQVDLEDTIWGELIKVPTAEQCKKASYLQNKKSRLASIKEISRGHKMLPDEWITPAMLETMNSYCNFDTLALGPKYPDEEKKIDKADQTFGLITTFVFFLTVLWLVSLLLGTGKGSGSFLFNAMLLRWFFK